MVRLLILLALVSSLLAGCSSHAGDATVAAAKGPRAIPVLHAERLVYECPKCGMDYDAAGACAMDSTALVKTAVDYTCPTDGKPVEHSGRCPRCAAATLVQKTAVADAAPNGGR
jgi:hypothetical protein